MIVELLAALAIAGPTPAEAERYLVRSFLSPAFCVECRGDGVFCIQTGGRRCVYRYIVTRRKGQWRVRPLAPKFLNGAKSCAIPARLIP